MKETYINEHGIKMVKMSLDDIMPPTKAQIERAKEAARNQSVIDDDCPPMSEEMQNRMRQRIKELKASRVATA